MIHQPIYDTTKVNQWLETYTRFLNALGWLHQIGSGFPARGTEIAALYYKNSPTQLRSIFLHGQYVAVIPEHNKTNNLRSSPFRTARFLDKFSSRVMIDNLVVLRTIADDLLAKTGKSKCGHVYINMGKPLDNFSEIVEEGFERFSEQQISIAQWRHITVALCNCDIFQNLLKSSTIEVRKYFENDFTEYDEDLVPDLQVSHLLIP